MVLLAVECGGSHHDGMPGIWPTASGIAQQAGAYQAGVVRTTSLTLPDDLLVKLNSEAKARRVTRSLLIRESLERSLTRRPPGGEVSCSDLASDLAGTVKGLPEDLADSPDYMKGFGQ